MYFVFRGDPNVPALRHSSHRQKMDDLTEWRRQQEAERDRILRGDALPDPPILPPKHAGGIRAPIPGPKPRFLKSAGFDEGSLEDVPILPPTPPKSRHYNRDHQQSER